MKTLILVGLLIGSVGLNIYLLNSPVIVQEHLDEDLKASSSDKIKMAQSALKRVASPKREVLYQRKELGPVKEKQSVKEEMLSDIDVEYAKQKESWQQDITSFFLNEMGLADEEIDSYFVMINEREKAISDYLAPKVRTLAKGQTYVLTIEDNIATGKINEEYLKILKASLGEEGFDQYQEFKESYNKSLIEKGTSYFLMEL